MTYYFQAEKMSVGYQGQPLITNIEIGLEKGEILTLIGPNGAGKSTILKSIAGQLQLIAGAIYLDKQSMLQMSGEELSQKMAVVFTQRLRAEMMTCEDVVATGRYPYTGRFGLLSRTHRQAVSEAMELVHVAAIKDQDFTRISDGQRQRVMLARAICQEPELIILDEPTSFLDIKYKLEFLSVLQEMRRKKSLTVIMSLHELELAAKISDKILCINGVCVDRFGSPGEVFVIAGGGSGRNVYRSLQRQQIAFSTGILFENDLDYPVARALAAEVFAAEAFEPISEETIERAKEQLDRCKRVICCRDRFGAYEAANQVLLEYAEQQGKNIVWQR